MAKRTGSSAPASHTPRRAARKDVAETKSSPTKGDRKRSAPEAPKSTALEKRSKGVASPPKSSAHATRAKTTAGSSRRAAESSRQEVIARGGASPATSGDRTRVEARRAGSLRQRLKAAAAARTAADAPPQPPLPPPGHESVRPPPRIPPPEPLLAPRSMELEWTGDPGGSSPPEEAAADRWARRGDELLLRLAKHGAADHHYRADLREGRFCWVDPAGHVSAEARAQLLCTFVPQTSSVTMGWADPHMAGVALTPVPAMPAEVDDIDEEGAWHVAMSAAEHAGAEYLYRVRSPARCLFLALSGLTFGPSRAEVAAVTPVAMVLATLSEARLAAELGAEPVDTLKARLAAAGATLLEQAEYTHRDTDWVARLVRTGKRLGALAERLPRPTFHSVAKGDHTVWLERRLADDLVLSLGLLEEEWQQFA
jgi:hypothetical protein